MLILYNLLLLRYAFPSLSSCRWCLKLYSLVVGGMGILFTFLWIVIHIYVLSQIKDGADLKVQR